MIIVADTGPVNYLILSGHIWLIPQLYGSLFIPSEVHRELFNPKAPMLVRHWVENLPEWVQVRSALDTFGLRELGPGERDAIMLALETRADFVLVDETLGRRIAVQHGLAVKGTLGVLEEAAEQRLINLPEAIEQLKATGIFLSEQIVETVLKRHSKEE